jgi:hypothetical protein
VAEAFQQVADARFDLLGDEDLRAVATDLAPDSPAVIVVRENTWAAEPGAAVRDSKGEVLMLERIPRDVVVQAVAALEN